MKLIEALNILQNMPSNERDAFRVYLATGFHSLHLRTFLAAELCRLVRTRPVEIQTGLYGDFMGNLERLERSEVEAGVIVIEWEDLDPRLGIRSLANRSPSSFADILENVRTRTLQIQKAIKKTSERILQVICLPTLPLPSISFTPGWQASSFELELKACIHSFSVLLAQFQQVRIINSQRIDMCYPLRERFDVASELRTGFPYKLSYASILAESLSRLIWAPSPKKGLITDLDNTLWKGILGEVGIEGVSWDLDHHSHMHGAYQQMLHALSSAGVLIGVASKNDSALVEQVFDKPDLILPRQAVCPMEAHWGAKSDSVARILKVWNIAACDGVFIDDSPLELAEVKAVFPEMECIHFPANSEEAVYELLFRLRDLFGKGTILEEDTIRIESIRRSYVALEDREHHRSTPDQFLEQAGAELYISFSKEPLDPRSLELINKTNQFNLNGKRHTEVSWRNYVKNNDTFLMIVVYTDKYGPLGKIATLAGRYKKKKLFVDIWAMSCRAFSRRIEHKCLEVLFNKYEADEIVFDFIATERNGPLQEFLADMLTLTPSAGCSLQRDQFVARRPQTFHRLLEVDNV